MEERVVIPTLNWFESNPWSKVGNKYTGSIGATDISKNAFHFRINFYRKDEGNELVAEVYDSISSLDKSIEKYTTRVFSGCEQGRKELIEWLDYQYQEFLDSGKDRLTVNFKK